MHKSKRALQIERNVKVHKVYNITDAVAALKTCSYVKFVENIDLALNLGIDARKPEQQVRGSVTLPSGLGKHVRVAVIAVGANAEAAHSEGADFVGDVEIEKKIMAGWVDFDVLITTPDMMRRVGALGKKLGPRGLMPSPKAGTVTNDIAKTLREFKLGKIELKSNRNGSIHVGIGKVNMSEQDIVLNIEAVIKLVVRLKPATAQGKYVLSAFISSTMGPGLKIDVEKLVN